MESLSRWIYERSFMPRSSVSLLKVLSAVSYATSIANTIFRGLTLTSVTCFGATASSCTETDCLLSHLRLSVASSGANRIVLTAVLGVGPIVGVFEDMNSLVVFLRFALRLRTSAKASSEKSSLLSE